MTTPTSAHESIGSTTFGYGPPTQAGKISFSPPGIHRECETAYWLWGDLASATAPPLIVLHGGPGAPGRDLRALAVLHERHGIPVLLYDQIGCGESTRLPELKGDETFWTDALFLAEIDNLRQHFKIEQFDLFGHSCGGMLAVLYAFTQPSGLRKLIIASCAASDTLRIRAAHTQRAGLPADMRRTLTDCEKNNQTDDPKYGEVYEELFRRHLCRIEPMPAEMVETMDLMKEDNTVPATLYGDNQVINSGSRKNLDLTKRLSEITTKTAPGGVLMTNGRHDMTPDMVMTPFFSLIQARVKWVRFAESSHMAHLEENQLYLETLGDFLTMP